MLTTSASLLGDLQHADDPKAWERFVHLYSPVLYKWSCRMGLRHDDALDMVQDVFIVLVKKLPEFSYDSGRGFRNWLFVVTRNKCREKDRRKSLNVDKLVRPDDVCVRDEERVERADFHRNLLDRVLPAMSSYFHESTWQAFSAHVIEEQPAAVVAARLGITISAVSKAKFRVMSRLHRELADLAPRMNPSKKSKKSDGGVNFRRMSCMSKTGGASREFPKPWPRRRSRHPRAARRFMFQNKRCPTRGELTEALLGRSSAAAAVAIEDHLDGCDHCQQAVLSLSVKSHVVDSLKTEPPAKAVVVPPDLEDLMTNLDAIHPGADSGLPNSGTRSDDFPVLVRSDNPDELGRLAHFRVIELLGAGGMGVVYRADDPKLQRSVALKVLRPRIAQDPEARARFLREARAVASIKHDHVVVVYDVGEAPSNDGRVTTPYLAMEFLEGVNLQTWMQSHPKPQLRAVVRLGRQIAEALGALHARGLIHRDVKPANIWIERKDDIGRLRDENGKGRSPSQPSRSVFCLLTFRAKLLDFGLAATSSDALSDARALGTPAYMAPEQFRGETVDARCDFFGLGCVLFELCTNEHPFPDRRFTAEHTVPMLASDLNPTVPPALANLIGRMLREDPGGRPESARRVVRELTNLEESLADTEAGVSEARRLRRSRSRSRSALLACVVGMAMAAAFGGTALKSYVFPPPEQAQQHGVAAAPVAPAPAIGSWRDEIRSLPIREQLKAVLDKLEELNPGYRQSEIEEAITPVVLIERFNESTDHPDRHKSPAKSA